MLFACALQLIYKHYSCFQQAAKDVSHALNNCVNFLPGQRDVDEAIKAVMNSSQSLAVEDVSKEVKTLFQSNLGRAGDGGTLNILGGGMLLGL